MVFSDIEKEVNVNEKTCLLNNVFKSTAKYQLVSLKKIYPCKHSLKLSFKVSMETKAAEVGCIMKQECF